MKIISWNSRGLGDTSKRLEIRKLIRKINPDMVLIQETKKKDFDM